MDQSDTVRKQFIFLIFFFFFAPVRKPQGSSKNSTRLTGRQYPLRSWRASCFRSRHCRRVAGRVGCERFPSRLTMFGHLPVSERDKYEPNHPMISGSWIEEFPSISFLWPSFILDSWHLRPSVLLLKVPLKKEIFSHCTSHILLISSYQLSPVFIWQVLSFLRGRGGHSGFEHTVWD